MPQAITTPKAEAAEVVVKKDDEIPLRTKGDYIAYIEREAPQYGVSPAKVEAIVSCESTWDAGAVGDHGHSYGLAQIYLPDHPTITKKEALDPKFALDYLIKHLKDHSDTWSCERV